MTHYSENSASVRFDFFKESGKWYMTEAVDMTGFFKIKDYPIPHSAVAMAWAKRCKDLGREPHDNFTIVVLDPYHEGAYPVMLPSGTYARYWENGDKF